MGERKNVVVRLAERKYMFAQIIEFEIKWCEENNGAMPDEFRKGFIAGLKQAVYLINAAKQRMVWQDGEMVDDEKLLDRAAELQRAPVQSEQKCPTYSECGWLNKWYSPFICRDCNGTGISNRSDGG
jgi:hypothetical protein